MKNKRILIFELILIILVVIALYFVFRSDAIKFKNEYELYNYFNNGEEFVKIEIPSDNKIKYIENDEVLDLFDSGTGVIYFGYPYCPWCRNAVPILLDVINESKLDYLYYSDVKSNSYDEEFKNKLIKIIGEYLKTDSNNEKRLYVPDVYFIKDGKIIGEHRGTVESQASPYQKLNSSQQEKLREIYQEFIDKMEE